MIPRSKARWKIFNSFVLVLYFSGKRRPSDPIGGNGSVIDTTGENNTNGAPGCEQIDTIGGSSPKSSK